MAANSPIISIGITRFLIRRSQVRILPGTPSSKSLCLGADHGQKRELGGVTITRGDLTSPGPLQLINAQIAAPAFLGHNHRLSKKRISPLSSIRRIIETRGHACADPRPSCRLGRDYTSVGLLLDAD